MALPPLHGAAGAAVMNRKSGFPIPPTDFWFTPDKGPFLFIGRGLCAFVCQCLIQPRPQLGSYIESLGKNPEGGLRPTPQRAPASETDLCNIGPEGLWQHSLLCEEWGASREGRNPGRGVPSGADRRRIVLCPLPAHHPTPFVGEANQPPHEIML